MFFGNKFFFAGHLRTNQRTCRRHVGGVFGTIAGTVISFLIGYLLVSLLNEMDVCDGGLALLS